jgi:hypothetical protein
MDKVIAIVLSFVLIFVVMGLLAMPAGLLAMLLWNAIVPVLFAGAPLLTFWKAVGLCLLCSILFKSFSSNNKA